MIDNLSFRAAKIEDLPILLEFEQGIIAAERPFDPTLKTTSFSYYDLAEMISDQEVAVIVGTLDQEIICSGYAQIKKAKPFLQHEKYAYLGFMFVQPEYRGKGINQLLVNELVVWAKTQGISEIQLTVYVDNLSALRAYEKAGFQKFLIDMRLESE